MAVVRVMVRISVVFVSDGNSSVELAVLVSPGDEIGISEVFVSEDGASVVDEMGTSELSVVATVEMSMVVVEEGNVRVIGLSVVAEGVEIGMGTVGSVHPATALCAVVNPLESVKMRSQVIEVQLVEIAKVVPEDGRSVIGLDV